MLEGEGQQLTLIIMLIVLATLIIGYSYYFYKKAKTYESYNMGGRAMPLLPMVLTTVGAAIGGSTLLGFMTDSYLLGMGQVWNVISIASSVALFTLIFVKRIRILGDKYKLYSVGDYAAFRYGEGARLPTFLGNIAALGALTGLQFVALATVLNLVFGLDMTLGIIISWLFVTVKTYLGGLTAVIWTDVIQGTIQTVGIVALFIAVYFISGGWGEVSTNISQNSSNLNSQFLNPVNIPIASILIPFLTIGAAILVRQDTWQRVWASKDVKTSVRANWWTTLIVFLVGVMIVVVGVFANAGLGMEASQPNLIYYEVIFGTVPFWFGSIMFVVLVATILSCADSFFIAGSTAIVSDLIKPRMKNQTDQRMLKFSRLMVVAMSVFSLVLAIAIPRLVELWMTGSAILVAGMLAPIGIGLFWDKPGKTAGVVSMWAGLAISVFWQLMGHPMGVHPVFVGFPISLVLFLGLTLLLNEENEWAKETENEINRA